MIKKEQILMMRARNKHDDLMRRHTALEINIGCRLAASRKRMMPVGGK